MNLRVRTAVTPMAIGERTERAATCKSRKEIMRELMADSKFAKAQAERGRVSLQKLRARPGFAAFNVERARKHLNRLHADPAYRARNAAKMRRQRTDPIFNARLNAALKKWRSRGSKK